MYVRPTIGGKVPTFGVSGKLWRDSLVMYDRDSRSLWSQVLGESVAGPAKGLKLDELPSQLTTWKDWVKRHPDTLVLKHPRAGRSTYEQYHYNRGMIGVRGSKNRDRRLGGKVLVFGMVDGAASAAVPMPVLAKKTLVNAEAFGKPIVVVSQPKQIAAMAYERVIAGRALTFEAEEDGAGLTLRDRETGSVWDWETGTAVEGELAGKRLARIEGTLVYWGIWAQFHEGSAVIK